MKVRLLKNNIEDWDLIAFEYDLNENTIYKAKKDDDGIEIFNLRFNNNEYIIVG